MHTILKFLKCRWLISQNVVNFSTCKKPQIAGNLKKTVDVKSGETFNISEVFKYFIFGQVVLHCIHQENV